VDDPPPDGWVDVVIIKPGGWNPGDLGRLVAGGQLPADSPAGKAGVHGLAHLAVVVGDQMCWVAKYPH